MTSWSSLVHSRSFPSASCQRRGEGCQSSAIPCAPCSRRSSPARCSIFHPSVWAVISHPGSSQRYGERTNQSPTGVIIYNFGEKDCSGVGGEDDRKQGFRTQSGGRETAPDGWGGTNGCISGNYCVCVLRVPNLSWRTQPPARGGWHFSKSCFSLLRRREAGLSRGTALPACSVCSCVHERGNKQAANKRGPRHKQPRARMWEEEKRRRIRHWGFKETEGERKIYIWSFPGVKLRRGLVRREKWTRNGLAVVESRQQNDKP